MAIRYSIKQVHTPLDEQINLNETISDSKVLVRQKISQLNKRKYLLPKNKED